jgi:hypothetical protein
MQHYKDEDICTIVVTSPGYGNSLRLPDANGNLPVPFFVEQSVGADPPADQLIANLAISQPTCAHETHGVRIPIWELASWLTRQANEMSVCKVLITAHSAGTRTAAELYACLTARNLTAPQSCPCIFLLSAPAFPLPIWAHIRTMHGIHKVSVPEQALNECLFIIGNAQDRLCCIDPAILDKACPILDATLAMTLAKTQGIGHHDSNKVMEMCEAFSDIVDCTQPVTVEIMLQTKQAAKNQFSEQEQAHTSSASRQRPHPGRIYHCLGTPAGLQSFGWQAHETIRS